MRTTTTPDQNGPPPAAMTLREFCAWSRLGKTSAYREVSAGRLRVVKVGAKTLILMSDAEAWLRSLPTAAA